jgi:hypothetical protein
VIRSTRRNVSGVEKLPGSRKGGGCCVDGINKRLEEMHGVVSWTDTDTTLYIESSFTFNLGLVVILCVIVRRTLTQCQGASTRDGS